MNDKALVASQYANDAILTARFDLHRRYTVGPELEPAVDAALALTGSESLLDIGTGPASFPARLRRASHRGRLVGADLNAGMLPRPRPVGIHLLAANAMALPFAEGAFDVVTARHMLYHVPDAAGALAEMRRVLRPGGRLLAVTNARDSMRAFWDTVALAAERYDALRLLDEFRSFLPFADHNAEELVRAAFGNARMTRVEAALEVPDLPPLERYFLSCLPGRPIDAERGLSAFREAAYRHLGLKGPYHIPKTAIVVTAER